MEQTGCARTTHEGEVSHKNPVRDTPDGRPFLRQALAYVLPPHGGTSKDMDSRQSRKPTTGDNGGQSRGRRGLSPWAFIFKTLSNLKSHLC